MARRKRRATSALKTRTWWNELRRQKNITLQEIADLCDLSEGQVSHIFSGNQMPADDFIEKVCELFDVDFFEGKLHFDAAHDARKAEKIQAQTQNAADDLLKVVYGKVDYDTYVKIRDAIPNSEEDALRQLYGSVDYLTYNRIAEALRTAKEAQK